MSLDTQTEECEKYILNKGYRVAGVYREEGVSGTKLDRPQLDRLRDDVRKGLFDFVVALDTDRLARNIGILTFLDLEFGKKGVEVLYVNTSEDQIVRMIKGVVGEIDNIRRREASVRNKIAKAKSGKVIRSSLLPYGYDYPPGTDTFTINEEEAEIVRLIFHLHTVEKLSTYEIARRFNNLGIKRKRDGGDWWTSTVRYILINPIYYGEYHWRKKTKEGRKYDVNEHIIIPVEPIIEKSTWDAAQAQLKRNQKRSRRKNSYEYLLTGGIARCARCGYSMLGSLSGSVKSEKKYRRYKCGGRANVNVISRGRKCDSPSYKAEVLEDLVWEKVVKLLSNPGLLLNLADRDDPKTHQQRRQDEQTMLTVIESEVTLASEEKNTAYLFTRGKITEEVYDQIKAELDQRRTGIEALKAEVSARLAAWDKAKADLQSITLLASLMSRLQNPSIEVKKRILEALQMKAIVVSDEIVLVEGLISDPLVDYVHAMFEDSPEEYAAWEDIGEPLIEAVGVLKVSTVDTANIEGRATLKEGEGSGADTGNRYRNGHSGHTSLRHDKRCVQQLPSGEVAFAVHNTKPSQNRLYLPFKETVTA